MAEIAQGEGVTSSPAPAASDVAASDVDPAQAREAATPFWARIEALWLALVPLCALFYALLQPLAPNDLWYHVRAGELLFASGRIPSTNAMSLGVPLSSPYYYQSWLSEAVLYLTLSRWSLCGLQWLRALCVGGAFVLSLAATMGWAKRENIGLFARARGAMVGALWAFLLASNNVDLRPQTFSLGLCALWVALLLRFWARPSLKVGLALGAVALVWANTHGAFVIAPLSLGALGVAQSVRERGFAKALWAATLGITLATLVNPRGAGLYGYLATMSSNTISQKYIQEWRPPGWGEWHCVLFWLSPLILVALWWRAKAPRAWWPFLAPVTFVFALGARDQRAMIWFALFGAPLLGLLVARLLPCPKSVAAPRAAQWLNGALVLSLCALPLALSPGVKTRFPWPDAFAARFAPTPTSVFPNQPPLLLERTTPTSAVAWWHQHPPARGERVWTDMVCGSFLTWATRPGNGGPVVLPLCDPRIEAFPEAFWNDYLRLSDGARDAGATLRARGFSQALLDRETMPALVRSLQRMGWKRVAANGSTVLLVAPSSKQIERFSR